MKEKERYFSPEIEVMDVQLQGVVCQSVLLEVSDPFSGNTEMDWA